MAQYGSRVLALLITSVMWPPAHAQQNSSSAMQLPPPVISVVNSCQNNNPDTCENIIPEFIERTVTFQIPEFQPGDQETHVYIVTKIGEGSGSGASTAKADENGLVRQRVAVTPENVDETQYYLVAVDMNTLEPRITLDLYEVGLRPFLNSLQGALRMGLRVATGIRFVDSTGAQSLMTELYKYQDQKLSIHGDNLTVDEILDKLYQQTRCVVDEEADRLLIAYCP